MITFDMFWGEKPDCVRSMSLVQTLYSTTDTPLNTELSLLSMLGRKRHQQLAFTQHKLHLDLFAGSLTTNEPETLNFSIDTLPANSTVSLPNRRIKSQQARLTADRLTLAVSSHRKGQSYRGFWVSDSRTQSHKSSHTHQHFTSTVAIWGG